MPELPEVETTRRGIEPLVLQRRIRDLVIREHRLRWPVPRHLPTTLAGATVTGVGRRSKYLLLNTTAGCLLVHLGMSGNLRLVTDRVAPQRHDHVDIRFHGGRILRLNDPRRFGSVLWTPDHPETHPLLARLGVEPLEEAFDGAYLHRLSRGRRQPIKAFIMDGHIVAGVGNIYASEALFLARIHPRRASGRISLARYRRLATEIRRVLEDAIQAGGTTLRDFVDGRGRPGYFGQQLRVYGRAGLPCPDCGATLRQRRDNQRATCYCPRCQH